MQNEKKDSRIMTKDVARRHILPTSDLFARWLFGDISHAELTKAFINAVLEDSGRT